MWWIMFATFENIVEIVYDVLKLSTISLNTLKMMKKQ